MNIHRMNKGDGGTGHTTYWEWLDKPDGHAVDYVSGHLHLLEIEDVVGVALRDLRGVRKYRKCPKK